MFGLGFYERKENKTNIEMRKNGYHFLTNFDKKDLNIYTESSKQYGLDYKIGDAYDCYGRKLDNHYSFNVNNGYGDLSAFWRVFDKVKKEIEEQKNKIETPINATIICELQPTSYTWITKSNNEVIDIQSFTNSASKFKVIFNNNATVVILEDGSRGVAKLNPKDKFDINKGLDIAYKRAKLKSIEKELEISTK